MTIPAHLKHDKINWLDKGNNLEGSIGNKDDGVMFYLEFQPTCYRRGKYKLTIEICAGTNHVKWGCFDHQDQPMRYYHHTDTAMIEAQAIARILLRDRLNYDTRDDVSEGYSNSVDMPSQVGPYSEPY